MKERGWWRASCRHSSQSLCVSGGNSPRKCMEEVSCWWRENDAFCAFDASLVEFSRRYQALFQLSLRIYNTCLRCDKQRASRISFGIFVPAPGNNAATTIESTYGSYLQILLQGIFQTVLKQLSTCCQGRKKLL